MKKNIPVNSHMSSVINNRILSIQNDILNKTLFILLITNVVGISLFVLRTMQSEFMFTYAFQISYLVINTIVVVFRRKITYQIRFYILIGILFMLSIYGIYSYGLFGYGVTFLIVASVLASAFASHRQSIVILGISAFIIIIFMHLFVTGRIVLFFDQNSYQKMYTSWIGILVIFLMFIGMLISVMSGLLKNLRELVIESNRHLHDIEELNTTLEEKVKQRKATEEMLRNKEEQLRITLEAGHVGIWEWNVINDMVYATPVYYTMLGYEPQTEPGHNKDWLDRVHPQDRDLVAKQFEKALSREFKEYMYEARIRQADGTYRWIQSKGYGFERDQSGLVTRLTGIHLDIHDRKSAEQEHLTTIHFFKSMDLINQAIRGTNDLEQMMSDVLDTMISIFDSDRAWLFYPCVPQATSWRVPMMCAKPEFPVASFVKEDVSMDPDTSEYLKIIADAGGQPTTFGQGSDHRLDKEFAKPHNYLSQIVMALHPKVDKPWAFGMHQCSYARVWTLEEKNLFREIGRRLADGLSTLLIFRNLQESEAKYRRIVDTTNEGIWMINENNITTFVNKRMAEMLGYKIEELIDLPCTVFMIDEDIADHFKRMKTQKLGISEVYEQRIRHKNGQMVWTLLSATPVLDEVKNFKGAFGMLTDITQRKATEEMLRKKEEQLRITLEAGHVGIWEWDIINDLVYATPVYYTMLGYEPQTEPGHNKDWLDRVHPQDRDYVAKQFEYALSRDFKEYQYEARIGQADGTYRWIQSKGYGFERDQRGLVTRLTGLRLDIHDRKSAEQEHLSTIHFFKSMDLINQAIRGTSDLDQMMSDVLGTMLTIFDSDRAYLSYPCDPQAPDWYVPMIRTKPEFVPDSRIRKYPMNPFMRDVSKKLIDAGEYPITLGQGSDYELDEKFSKEFNYLNAIFLAVYPKIGQSWVLGMHQCSYARVWTEEERNLFREIGRRLADGLTTLQMFRNLQESEAKYRRIVDTTNEGIWMVDENLKTTFVNARVAEMLGYTVEEIECRSFDEFVPEEDRLDCKERAVKRNQGVSEIYERRYRHKNGNLIWTLISSTPILDNQKNFKGSFAMLTDITQRKLVEEKLRVSEERLRITIESAQIGIWDWDLVNNLWYSTPNSYTELGYKPILEPVGLNKWLEIIHPDDLKMINNLMEKVILSKSATSKKFEIRYRHANGSYRWMQAQAFVVNRDKDGRITRMVGVRFDIDERKRAEEELKRYQEHLEDLVTKRTKELSETNKQLLDAKGVADAANKAKSRFLASMSHELRTPLNAILGYAQIFERDATLSGHQKTGIEIIKSSGEHLLMLISDILDLSRIEANKIELHPSRIDLSVFMDSIKDVISIRAESKQISVNFQLEPDLPHGIIADETRLRQILLNLLGNAIKFTDSGYVICRVSAVSCQKGNVDGQCTIHFEVKDTGMGMRNDQLERIFAPFEQVSEIPMREGVGLGLAISRQLVQMMGGDIFVESELGKGSRFWFDLTFSITDVSAPLKPAGKAISGYKGVRKKILIVDDHQTNRLVLIEWFSQLGFDTSEAENGFQAISIAQQIQPDIIIMDLLMPGLGGFDAALKIREIPELSNVVMIEMSASITNVTDEQYAKAGFNDAISKPVDLEMLSNMLRKHMRIEWVYREPTVKTTEEITEPVILPPPEELKILQKHILRGDMLQLSKRAQHIETLGKQYIPFARKLKLLADTFQERRIEAMVKDALKKQNGNH